VGALFKDTPASQDQDTVGAPHGREAVGDHDGGATGEEASQGLFYLRLRFQVHAARRFVEDEEFGIGDQGAGEGDELALPDGEPATPFADLGLVALREAPDKVVGPDGFGGGDYLLLGGVRAAVADVVLYGAGEEEGVLEHDAHVAAQRRAPDVAKVLAVHLDLTLRGVS
jgi:hypothetical protein